MGNEKCIAKLKGLLVDLNFSSQAPLVDTTEDLFAAGALDSLTLIQYVLAIEDGFGIRIDNGDITYENFKSLGQLATVLEQKYSAFVS